MNILIMGASGLTGNAILNTLAEDYNVYGTYFSQHSKCADAENMFYLDIANTETFERISKKTTPQIIISCLNGDFENQLKIHEKAAEYISNIDGGKLIYLSTANVFDQVDTLPHYENDTMSSQSDYGQFKISCEKLLTNVLGKNAIIISPPFIWGKASQRLKKMLQDIQTNTPIKVWSNLFTNHTTDIQIARCVNMIIKWNREGIFHVGSDEACDYSGFIKALIKELQLPMPEFEIDEMPYRCYLAVLSAREDIPSELRMTNEGVISYLAQ